MNSMLFILKNKSKEVLLRNRYNGIYVDYKGVCVWLLWLMLLQIYFEGLDGIPIGDN